MKLRELFKGAGLDFPRELGETEINEIITDSRRVHTGCLFVCIDGERFDGHDYIGDAINAGAKVIVAEKVRGVGEGGAAAIISVENTRRAASLLYNSWYGVNKGDMKLIGVTGTNGKTSVTNILKNIFETDGKRCGLIGTLGCFLGDQRIDCDVENERSNMTTPDPRELYSVLSRMKERGAEYVILEVSSHSLALSKVDALHFDLAVFTNLTQDHLDFHKNMENYLKAKSKLFTMCDKALINIDDKSAERIIKNAQCKGIYTVSTKGFADYYAENARLSLREGVEYELVSSSERRKIKSVLGGSFALVNTLMAAAAADICEIEKGTVDKSLMSIRGIDGRMEKVVLPSSADLTVYIDYAHTPDALEKLLVSIREGREGNERIVILFGCGGERDRGKRKEMAQIASRLADFVIVTSDNSRGEPKEQIFKDILRGIDKEKEFVLIEDRKKAIEYAVFNSCPRDIIVLAGKGHERYEIDSSGKHPFDERKIVKEAYEKSGNRDI